MSDCIKPWMLHHLPDPNDNSPQGAGASTNHLPLERSFQRSQHTPSTRSHAQTYAPLDDIPSTYHYDRHESSTPSPYNSPSLPTPPLPSRLPQQQAHHQQTRVTTRLLVPLNTVPRVSGSHMDPRMTQMPRKPTNSHSFVPNTSYGTPYRSPTRQHFPEVHTGPGPDRTQNRYNRRQSIGSDIFTPNPASRNSHPSQLGPASCVEVPRGKPLGHKTKSVRFRLARHPEPGVSVASILHEEFTVNIADPYDTVLSTVENRIDVSIKWPGYQPLKRRVNSSGHNRLSLLTTLAGFVRDSLCHNFANLIPTRSDTGVQLVGRIQESQVFITALHNTCGANWEVELWIHYGCLEDIRQCEGRYLMH